MSLLSDISKKIVKDNTEVIISANLTEKETIEELRACHPPASAFVAKYTSFDGGSVRSGGSVLKGVGNQLNDVQFKATGVFATEEESFVPALGIKGFVDVTIEAELTSKADIFAGECDGDDGEAETRDAAKIDSLLPLISPSSPLVFSFIFLLRLAILLHLFLCFFFLTLFSSLFLILT